MAGPPPPMQDNDIRPSILDAYTRLDHHQLQLFLRLRALPSAGSHSDLAVRLTEHDLRAYAPARPAPPRPAPRAAGEPAPAPAPARPLVLAHLPVDLLAEILDHLGSWELAKAVGVPSALPRPPEWHAATPLDCAILSASLPRVRAAPLVPPFTRLGAALLVRFALRDILDYLWAVPALRPAFRLQYGDSLAALPTLASLHNRPRILDWWLAQPDIAPKAYSSDAVDGACRSAALAALAWWDANAVPAPRPADGPAAPPPARPPCPPRYTAQALESASLKGHTSVLAFFAQHAWPLRPGRALDMASSAGHVHVLDWWAYESGLEIGTEVKYDKHAVYHASCAGRVAVLAWWKAQSERGKGRGGKGIQMIFDEDALVGATRHNKPEVLEWWDKSGLSISYRMCDIEAALEDAIGGGDAARAWWARKGVNFRAGDSEWMKMQSLN